MDPDVGFAADVQLAVMRLARRMRLQRTEGLTASQFSALATLARSGSIPMGELAHSEAVAAPTMTKTVEKLEQESLVRRIRNPEDARVSVVELTDGGRELVEAVRTARRAWLSERIATLDDGERAALQAALPALRKLSDL